MFLDQKGLTKYALSKKSGVPKTTIIDICSGKSDIEKCSAKTIRQLSKALDCSMDELMDSIDNIDINGFPLNKEYLEENLPKLLIDGIAKLKKDWKIKDKGQVCLAWDSDYCELQSNINICEIANIISSEQAWYLREKYLRLERI